MKPVKIEYTDQPPFSNPVKMEHQSAFRFYQQKENEQIEQNKVTDIETYINKRKTDNSFTLADISVSSSENQSKDIKIQISKQTSETKEHEEIVQQKKISKDLELIRVFQIGYEPKYSLKRLSQLQFDLNIVSETFFPITNSSFSHQKKVQQKDEQSFQNESGSKLKFFDSEDHSSTELLKIQKNQNSKKQRKREKKKEKTYLEKQQSQKLQNNKSNKSNKIDNKVEKKDEKQRKSKDVVRMKSQKYSNKKQLIEQIPFDGVLRNCKCCGKLISKLCFKCPHIYCKAQNCPRKRKKILNEKMLQRMKEQKIKQHYRQRQLYEKMKIQKGDNFNPKLINAQTKLEGLKEENPSSRRNKKMNIQISTQSQEFETSEEGLDSDCLYDSQSEDEIQEKSNDDKPESGKKTENSNKHKNIKRNGKEKHLSNNKSKKVQKLNQKPLQNKIKAREQQKHQVKSEFSASFLQSLILQNIQNEEKEGKNTEKLNKKGNNQRNKKNELYFNEDQDSYY